MSIFTRIRRMYQWLTHCPFLTGPMRMGFDDVFFVVEKLTIRHLPLPYHMYIGSTSRVRWKTYLITAGAVGRWACCVYEATDVRCYDSKQQEIRNESRAVPYFVYRRIKR